MQKIHIFLIFIFSLYTNKINAQHQEPCQTPEVTADYLKNDNLVFKSSTGPYHLKTRFFVINDNNGNGGRSNEEIITAFNNLQQAFNQYDIYFSFEDIQPINDCYWYNDVFFQDNPNDAIAQLGNSNYVSSEYIDIFVLPQYFPNFNITRSYASAPGGIIINGGEIENEGSTTIVIGGTEFSGDKLLFNYSENLIHEMGHCLGLLHTFQGTSPCDSGTPEQPVPIGENPCTAPYESNSASGDFVCDTPADPKFLSTTENCEWDGNNQSACNTSIPNASSYSPDFNNLMSYSFRWCRNNFTLGQVERMKTTLNIEGGVLETVLTESLTLPPSTTILDNPSELFITEQVEVYAPYSEITETPNTAQSIYFPAGDDIIFNRIIEEDIIIPNGVTFVIDKANLTFLNDVGIYVQKGGLLIIEDSQLMPYLSEPTCGNRAYWKGIRVEGQGCHPLEINEDFNNTAANLGLLVIKNSTIQQAVLGVNLSDSNSNDLLGPIGGAGMCKIENSTFLNCKRGILVGPHLYDSNPELDEEPVCQNPSQVHISNCEFKFTKECFNQYYIDLAEQFGLAPSTVETHPYVGIELTATYEIDIQNCRFIKEGNDLSTETVGIEAYSSGFRVIGDENDGTIEFENLDKGINMHGEYRMTDRMITNNTFKNVSRGITINNGVGDFINNNLFTEIPFLNDDQAYGIAMWNSFGLEITNNRLNTNGIVSTTNIKNEAYGILLKSTYALDQQGNTLSNIQANEFNGTFQGANVIQGAHVETDLSCNLYNDPSFSDWLALDNPNSSFYNYDSFEQFFSLSSQGQCGQIGSQEYWHTPPEDITPLFRHIKNLSIGENKVEVDCLEEFEPFANTSSIPGNININICDDDDGTNLNDCLSGKPEGDDPEICFEDIREIKDHLRNNEKSLAIEKLVCLNKDWSNFVLTATYLNDRDLVNASAHLSLIPEDTERNIEVKSYYTARLAEAEAGKSFDSKRFYLEAVQKNQSETAKSLSESALVRLKEKRYLRKINYNSLSEFNNSNSFSDLSIYPNPATDFFTIYFNGEEKEYQIELLDLQGKVMIKQVLLDKNACNISTTDLPNGIYICKLSQNGQTITSQKLIILK